jgi:hypothetical protein
VKATARTVLFWAGLPVWTLGVALLGVSILVAALAEWLHPDGTHGNCWTYAMSRYWRHGGYLMIRRADDVRLLGCIAIPHASWVKALPAEGVDLEQYQPDEREPGRWWPWHVLWYRGIVGTVEDPHPATVKESL